MPSSLNKPEKTNTDDHSFESTEAFFSWDVLALRLLASLRDQIPIVTLAVDPEALFVNGSFALDFMKNTDREAL